MQILILGANGFIGSHLVDALLEHDDICVFAIDKEDHNSYYSIQNPRCNFLKCDVLNSAEMINDLIIDSDIVIPLIALPYPESFIRDPVLTFDLTFLHNLNIIRKCTETSTRIVFPSSSEVYGLCSEQPLNEQESLLITGPACDIRWIYSASKQLLERLLFAFCYSEKLHFTIFRPFNWFGPRLDNSPSQNGRPNRVVTSFIRSALSGDDLIVVNRGIQTRSFTYISDGISALIQLIFDNSEKTNQGIYNIGNPNNLISISSLSEIVIDLVYNFTNKKVNCRYVDGEFFYGDGYSDINNRLPDISLIKSTLGWSPKISLKEGLIKTIEYMIETEGIVSK